MCILLNVSIMLNCIIESLMAMVSPYSETSSSAFLFVVEVLLECLILFSLSWRHLSTKDSASVSSPVHRASVLRHCQLAGTIISRISMSGSSALVRSDIAEKCLIICQRELAQHVYCVDASRTKGGPQFDSGHMIARFLHSLLITS